MRRSSPANKPVALRYSSLKILFVCTHVDWLMSMLEQAEGLLELIGTPPVDGHMKLGQSRAFFAARISSLRLGAAGSLRLLPASWDMRSACSRLDASSALQLQVR